MFESLFIFDEMLNLLNLFHSKMKEQQFSSELLILPLMPQTFGSNMVFVVNNNKEPLEFQASPSLPMTEIDLKSNSGI